MAERTGRDNPSSAPAEVWEEAENLAERFREKLISLRGMDAWPRRSSLLAIAGMLLAALLIATHELPGLPGPSVSTSGTSGTGTIPVIDLAGCVILSILAWSYLLAGALHAHWALRLGVMILFTLVGLNFAVQGVPILAADVFGLHYFAQHLHHRLTVPQILGIIAVLLGDAALPVLALTVLAVLGGLWVAVMVRWIQERVRHAPPRGLAWTLLLACLLVTAALYLLESLGGPLGSAYPLASAVGEQLLLYGFIVLPLVLFVTASDFAEWAEVVAGNAVARARGLHRAVLPAIAIVVSLAVLADSARTAGGVGPLGRQLVPAVIFGVVALVMGRLLLVVARPLRVGMVGLMGTGLVVYLLSILPPVRGVGFYVWVLGMVALTCAAVVVGRRHRRAAVTALLFGLAMVVVLLDDWHHGDQALLTPDQLRTGAALVCLIGTAVALIAHRLQTRGLHLIRLLLVLLLGLQLLSWIADLFHASAAVSFAPLQAVVMLLGLLWDVAMSGETVTNVRGRRVPHHSRVLLYFGYQLLAAAAIVWFYTSSDSGAFRDTDSWISSGIQLLGAPLLVVFFSLGFWAWWRGRRPEPAEEVARQDL